MMKSCMKLAARKPHLGLSFIDVWIARIGKGDLKFKTPNGLLLEGAWMEFDIVSKEDALKQFAGSTMHFGSLMVTVRKRV